MIRIIFVILIFSALSINEVMPQDALTADILHASKENNCEDGSIDLTISGGYPPYCVVWNYNNCNPNPLIPVIELDGFHSISGIQGTNDGEDIDAPAFRGCYTVVVTDALCGSVEASFEIKCECSGCEIIGVVKNENCSAMNGSIGVSLDCSSEDNANQMYSYIWGDLDPNIAQSGNRENLSAGEYCLTVSDEGGSCEYTNCWTVKSVSFHNLL